MNKCIVHPTIRVSGSSRGPYERCVNKKEKGEEKKYLMLEKLKTKP